MKVLLAFPRILLSQSMSMFSSFKGMFPADVQVIVPEEGTEEELVQLAADADIIICLALSEKVALAAKKLKLVQKIGAGVDGIPFDVLRKEVAVANTSGANPAPVAEGAVALVLAQPSTLFVDTTFSRKATTQPEWESNCAEKRRNHRHWTHRNGSVSSPQSLRHENLCN